MEDNYIKTCEMCGKEFTSYVSFQKYCSIECQQMVNYIGKGSKIYYYTCKHCGKDFISAQPNRKFCSHECHVNFVKRPNNHKQQTENQSTVYNKTCPYCGKYFSTNRSTQVYCSKYCRNMYQKEKQQQKNKKVNAIFTEDNYKECISVIVTYLIKQGIQGRDNCGISKYYTRGVLTNKLRNDVLKRDNRQCSVCGATTNLEVHHIVKVKHGGTNDMDNLITLCTRCHRAIDTLNLEHAISKCAKNAEKRLGIKSSAVDLRTIKEKVQDAQADLLSVYKLLINKIDDPDIQEITTQLNNIIDDMDNIK